MVKMKQAHYTLEFKLEAMRLISIGQKMGAVAATLGIPNQSLNNLFKANKGNKLGSASSKPTLLQTVLRLLGRHNMAFHLIRKQHVDIQYKRNVPSWQQKVTMGEQISRTAEAFLA